MVAWLELALELQDNADVTGEEARTYKYLQMTTCMCNK